MVTIAYLISNDFPDKITCPERYIVTAAFHVNDIPVSTTKWAAYNSPTGYTGSFFTTHSGTIYKLAHMIDNGDTSYSSWTNGTLTWRILKNNSTAWTGTVFTKATFDSGVSGTRSKAQFATPNVTFSADDEINVQFITSASWNSTGAEVCGLLHMYYDN